MLIQWITAAAVDLDPDNERLLAPASPLGRWAHTKDPLDVVPSRDRVACGHIRSRESVPHTAVRVMQPGIIARMHMACISGTCSTTLSYSSML